MLVVSMDYTRMDIRRRNAFDVLANVGELKVDLVVDLLHDGQDQVAKGMLQRDD